MHKHYTDALLITVFQTHLDVVDFMEADMFIFEFSLCGTRSVCFTSTE